ncbi:Trm112 family protein [Streptomyces sp. NPDC055103]
MKPDNPLLKILACPLDKGPLVLDETGAALHNPRLRRSYPIVDGIPQLLPSSGVPAAAGDSGVGSEYEASEASPQPGR